MRTYLIEPYAIFLLIIMKLKHQELLMRTNLVVNTGIIFSTTDPSLHHHGGPEISKQATGCARVVQLFTEAPTSNPTT